MLLLKQSGRQKGPKPARGDAVTWGGRWTEGWRIRVGLPTQRKESNICPISNTMLDSRGTELLVRRKLTFSCIYELNL